MPEIAARSVPFQFGGVVARKQTYRNLVYFFLRFPLGMLYFLLFGLVLVVIFFGDAVMSVAVAVASIPLLLAVANYLATIEADVATDLLDVDLSWEPADPREMSLPTYAGTILTDPRNYGLVVYFAVQVFVGAVAIVAMAVGLMVPLQLLVAPLVYWIPGVRYELLTADGTDIVVGPTSVHTGGWGGPIYPIVIDTLPEALAASVVSVGILLVVLHLFNAIARGWTHLLVWLLDSA